MELKKCIKTRSPPGGALGRPRVENGAKMESKVSQNGSNFDEIYDDLRMFFLNPLPMVLALFAETFLEHY